MLYFDRFDICAAYNVYSVLWGGDGYAYENRTQVRLSRIKYRPSDSDQRLETLNENARAIYEGLVERHQVAREAPVAALLRGHAPGSVEIRDSSADWLVLGDGESRFFRSAR